MRQYINGYPVDDLGVQMKRGLPLLLILLLAAPAWAGAPTRQNSYTSNTTISSTAVTANEDAIFSYLQSGVDTYAALSISSAALAAGAVTTSKIATSAITTALLLDGTIATADIATGAITTGLILDGTITPSDMSGSPADDAVPVADSASAQTYRALPNCTDTGGNHLNYTTATNAFSCGTSSAYTPVSNIVTFSRTASAGSGAQGVTGMGFQSTLLMVQCVEASTARVSFGIGDDDADEQATRNGGAGGVWDQSAGQIVTITDGTNMMTAVLTSLDSDGFTVTWTKTSSGQDVTCQAIGAK